MKVVNESVVSGDGKMMRWHVQTDVNQRAD